MLTFLHTADIQVGMPFHKIPGDAGARVRQARLDVLDTLARSANERRVAFTLIAGDFFDSHTLDPRIVAQACGKLAAFAAPVFILPGNHDYAGTPDSVYEQPLFQRECPAHVTVLREREPRVIADGKAVLLPAPLLQRHAWGDASAHITAEFGADSAPGAIRIGLAHGDVAGFEKSGQEARNFIEPDRATHARLDYLALGDWHGTKEINPRTWYAGAPEPTSFDQPEAGLALFVSIEAQGSAPHVERVPTGQFQWTSHVARLAADADADAVVAWLEAIGDAARTLARVELIGEVSVETMQRLRHVLDVHGRRLLHLRERLAKLHAAPSEAELAGLALEGYVARAADELRARSRGTGNDAEAARDALALLYRLERAEDQS